MTRKAPSRYDLGKNIINHKGKDVSTSLNTEFENLLTEGPKDKKYRKGAVISYIENRPDTLSYIYYNTPYQWWYIMAFNNMKDPFEDMNLNDRILIPDLNGN